MNKLDLIKLGSKTATKGFKNENDIVIKFNNWHTDKDIKSDKISVCSLLIMKYEMSENI